MDFEAPMDAWFVYIGLAIVSTSMLGVAVGFTPMPPPDANAAANAVDSAAGTSVSGVAVYDHDAEFVWMDRQQIALQNDGGSSKATVAYGEITPAYEDERLLEVLYGAPIEDEFDSSSEFLGTVEAAKQASAANREDWRSTTGELRAKKVIVNGEEVVLVDV